MNNKSVSLQTWLAFIFGLVGLGALLAVGLFADNHNPLLVTVSRIILAMACAGIAAVIPGLLHLNFNPSLTANIRAGGALAVFVLVYFFNPPGLMGGSEKILKPPPEDYMPVVNKWISLIDGGQYENAYNTASTHTKQAYEATFFIQLYESHAATVSPIVSRRLVGAYSSTSLQTGEKGQFRFVSYEITYSNGKKELEHFIITAENDKWKIRDHSYFPMANNITPALLQSGGD